MNAETALFIYVVGVSPNIALFPTYLGTILLYALSFAEGLADSKEARRDMKWVRALLILGSSLCIGFFTSKVYLISQLMYYRAEFVLISPLFVSLSLALISGLIYAMTCSVISRAVMHVGRMTGALTKQESIAKKESNVINFRERFEAVALRNSNRM